MKQLLFCSTLIIFLSITAFSQEKTESRHYTAVKFAPAGLFAGKITLGGEYNFKNRKSITLVAGIPFEKTQKIEIDGKNSNMASKAFSIMGGYRYYLGKKSMGGFYVEPYAKYLKHEAKGQLPVDLNGENVIFDNYTKYEGIGVGLQLGVQFVIAKLVIVDMYILGPEANSSKFSTISTDITNSTAWDYADAQDAETTIKDALKDIPIVGKKIEVTVDTNKRSVFTSYSGFLPGIRMGTSFGIRF